MAAVRHLGFVMCALGLPTKSTYLVIFITAKFGWNRCSSFDNMHVFRFCEFDLKMPIHARPKIEFFDPLNGEPCEQIPKKHILARVRVVRAIMRENPSSDLTCR